MAITVIAFGKLREAYFRDAENEYIKRIKPFTSVSFIELTPEKLPDSPSAAEISKALEREGEMVASKIRERDYIIPLVVEGRGLTSEDFSRKLSELSVEGRDACFIIGSSHGLSPAVKKLGRMSLSLSSLTLPHQLARVVLAEQIYRALTIQKNMKYHK